jgi:hypothetical protein
LPPLAALLGVYENPAAEYLHRSDAGNAKELNATTRPTSSIRGRAGRPIGVFPATASAWSPRLERYKSGAAPGGSTQIGPRVIGFPVGSGDATVSESRRCARAMIPDRWPRQE